MLFAKLLPLAFVLQNNDHRAFRRQATYHFGLFVAPTGRGVDEIHRRERTVVIMYNKPPNVITSHSNADTSSAKDKSTTRRRTVYEDIYSMKGFVADSRRPGGIYSSNFEEATQIQSKLHAIGRLDADTTGLLLLTNDGALVHRITNPNAKMNVDGFSTSINANAVQKTYEALIMGHHILPQSFQQSSATVHSNNNKHTSNRTNYPLQTLLEKGASLSAKHGGHTKPVDALSVLSHPTRSTTRISITISEGKNRQIRRMFHAVGSGVMKLHRVSVGKLTLHGLINTRKETPKCQGGEDSDLDGLKEGQWRLLTEDEIEKGLGWKCGCLDEFNDSTPKTAHKHKRRGKGIPRRIKGRRRR